MIVSDEQIEEMKILCMENGYLQAKINIQDTLITLFNLRLITGPQVQEIIMMFKHNQAIDQIRKFQQSK